MDFLQWKKENKKPSVSSSSSTPNLNLQQTLSNLQTQCTDFLQNLSKSLQQQQHHFNSSPKPHLHQTLETLICHAKNSVSALGFGSNWGENRGAWARIPPAQHRFDISMSIDAIEERLAGVPVYALSNSAEEFVLVSGVSSGKSLGLFCFREEDAEALLDQMRSMDPEMRRGSKVVAVALNKAIQLKLKGVGFRMIPESTQIQNALKVKQEAGLSDDGFSGVPVFQSQSLFLKSENKRYRPFFFRKEDLENSLKRASQQQRQLNPAFRQGDIQVAVFEEIIKGMKENLASKWDDVVFIPPGFDVSTALPQNNRLTANG